jgi:predicted transcriptional regulator
MTGYPQHMIRYSLRILEQERLIEPSSRGAVVTENLDPTMIRLKKALQHIQGLTEDLLRNIQ